MVNIYTGLKVYPNADYNLDKVSDYLSIRPLLTPKVVGAWVLNILQPNQKESMKLIELDAESNITLNIIVSDKIFQHLANVYPKLVKHTTTTREMIDIIIANTKNTIERKAVWHIYQFTNRNVDETQSIVKKLDEQSTEPITLKSVKTLYNFEKSIYTNTVVDNFLMNKRWRWQQFNKWHNDLGYRYAYNSAKKYVKGLLQQKYAYIHNKSTNPYMKSMGGIDIAYLYALFYKYNNPYTLVLIFKEFERRTTC